VGKGQMIEHFDDAMVGMSVGDEKSVSVTFPDDYQAEKLRGKIAEFDITLKQAAHAHVPELDNEFFKSFGVDNGGEERFREVVRDNMYTEMNAAIQSQVKRQVLDEICRLHDFALPDSLIEREIKVLRERMHQQLQMSLNTENSSLPDDLFRKEAEKRVSVGLVVNAIIERESLKPDGDKVRARIEEIAKPYEQPDQIVNWYYSDEAQLQQMELAVLEDQVVEHVLTLGTVETLSTSYEDIISGRATAPLEQAREEISGDADASDTVSDNQGG
jgi:trigger factor